MFCQLIVFYWFRLFTNSSWQKSLGLWSASWVLLRIKIYWLILGGMNPNENIEETASWQIWTWRMLKKDNLEWRKLSFDWFRLVLIRIRIWDLKRMLKRNYLEWRKLSSLRDSVQSSHAHLWNHCIYYILDICIYIYYTPFKTFLLKGISLVCSCGINHNHHHWKKCCSLGKFCLSNSCLEGL